MASDSNPSGPTVRAIPEGDTRERLLCPDCGYVAYENPKVIVGSVAVWRERILLCRRAIVPRAGFWTLPAGFLENHETTRAGAMREAWEEARARIAIDALLAVFEIPRINQVQMIYRAELLDPAVEAGVESEAVGLFGWDEIPWDDLAFPTVRWALEAHRARRGERDFPAAGNPPGAGDPAIQGV